MKTIHIVGGGITGCSLAYALKSNFNIILYEKQPQLGGLLTTLYNLENIPYQKGPHIIHTDKQWIIDFLRRFIHIQPVKYSVAISPLIDLQYYDFPFTKETLDRMPWHWKEAIKLDMEQVNGASAENIKNAIINFYGKTIYEIFYKEYFKKLFRTTPEEIDTTLWYRNFLRIFSNTSNYFNEATYFPIDEGYNSLFTQLVNGVDVKLKTEVTYKDFSSDDTIVLTTRPDLFFDEDELEYVTASFDIDSVLYSKNKPDTMIYPNYVPFTLMTQFGKFFTPEKNHNKNIVVKEYPFYGDEEVYPIPSTKNYKKVKNIKNKYNIYYCGWQVEYSFSQIAESIDKAFKKASEIKHKEHI
jgi:UDP-galactopyranose mutase